MFERRSKRDWEKEKGGQGITHTRTLPAEPTPRAAAGQIAWKPSWGALRSKSSSARGSAKPLKQKKTSKNFRFSKLRLLKISKLFRSRRFQPTFPARKKFFLFPRIQIWLYYQTFFQDVGKIQENTVEALFSIRTPCHWTWLETSQKWLYPSPPTSWSLSEPSTVHK